MNSEAPQTALPGEDFSSNDAARGALHRRAGNRRTDAPDHARSDTPVPADDASARAKRPRRLRRWSVAELVARAVAQPRSAAPATEGR